MSERERQIPHDITYMLNLKYVKNEPIYKTETDSTDMDNRLVVADGGSGMDWEFGVSRCDVLLIEWIKTKVILYSTWNYIQYLGINHNRKDYRSSHRGAVANKSN